MELQSEREAVDAESLKSLIQTGLLYAARRFEGCPALQKSLECAEIYHSEDIDTAFEIDPPSVVGRSSVVRYSNQRMLQVISDHAYPAWVISATIERLILARITEWERCESQIREFITHRDQRREAQVSRSREANNSSLN